MELVADGGCALSGRMFCAFSPQGFTLGCHLSPLWGGWERVDVFIARFDLKPLRDVFNLELQS